MTGTIVAIAHTTVWALYLAVNVEYNAIRFVDKPTIAAEIRSIEY
jgi:hypothetical protein